MSDENTRSKSRAEKRQTDSGLEPANDLERHQRETLNSLVRQQVMHMLGNPGELLNVQVRPLWGANYRVNVFVGANVACARISDSFFLATDGDGHILESTPAIKRLY